MKTATSTCNEIQSRFQAFLQQIKGLEPKLTTPCTQACKGTCIRRTCELAGLQSTWQTTEACAKQDQSFRIHGCQHSTSKVPGELKQQCILTLHLMSPQWRQQKHASFFCRGRSNSPTQDLEIHLRHELPCTCLLSCSWNMPKVPGDCYLSHQMELKLGLSPSNHFGKAKVHEEAEEKTTHNKCGCEAEVHVLQLAFHIMEPHTIKWGFLPNIPGPLPGFDFLGIIIEHHNESPLFVLAVNKALTWRRLEGHFWGQSSSE